MESLQTELLLIALVLGGSGALRLALNRPQGLSPTELTERLLDCLWPGLRMSMQANALTSSPHPHPAPRPAFKGRKPRQSMVNMPIRPGTTSKSLA